MYLEKIDGVLFRKALNSAAKLLEINKEEVNSLNVFPVPDGDTGTNMCLTVESAVTKGLSVTDNDVYKIALATSQGSLMGARGNSGVILSQLFRGFANGLKGKEIIDIKTFAEGLKKASDTAYNAVMKPTEGTILTVARECAEFALKHSNEEKNIVDFLERIIQHGDDVLERTPEMLPVLKQAGVVDSGGKGLMYLYKGFYNGLIGKNEHGDIESPHIVLKTEESKKQTEAIDSDDIKFAYCTEFMINTNYSDIEAFRNELSELGDSLLAVSGEGIIKVHIHTNNPGIALEKALKLGSLNDIKIDNMRYQHEEILLKDELKGLKEENIEANNKIKDIEINKEYSLISVSIGEGINEIFNDLNVDAIVSGGQTMNPSTEDLLKAIDTTHGKNVIILPNNSNIILAAEQAKELSNRKISVIPTKNIAQGISALLAFNEEATLEENIEIMTNAINTIKSAQVTYAVRDTEYNNNKIIKDDIIGLSDKEILSSGKDINQVSTNLIEQLVDDDTSIITIFFGNNVDEVIANELATTLEGKYENIDIEVIFGGQPLYYYIFSIE